MTALDSFPRQYARTGRFLRGEPRAVTVSSDGERVIFLRSGSGIDPAASLWVYDVGSAEERVIADPQELLAGGTEQVPAEERARRERARESGAGVVAYACDRDCTVASFALSGRLFAADLVGGGARDLQVEEPVVDPRPDPTGSRVAYCWGGALCVVDLDGSAGHRVLAEPDAADVRWGIAEFVAAEEMQRNRGFWWSPDGQQMLAARVDESPVQRWWIADPANPGTQPTPQAYPAAGTPNAEVRLFVFGIDGGVMEVDWDRTAFEYVVTADWSEHGLLVVVQSRDQRTMQVLEVDPSTGATQVRHEDTDPVWLEIVPGVPTWAGGQLVWVADVGGWRRLVVDGQPVTPDGLQLRAVLHADDDGVLFQASTEPTDIDLWRWRRGVGAAEAVECLTSGAGVHGGASGGGTLLVARADLDSFGTTFTVRRDGSEAGALRSHAETPLVTPQVAITECGPRGLRTALVLPSRYEPAHGPLPVLMHPYGGPHAQRVLAARAAFLTEQWLADQGFAVVIIDGRGTPGRGSEWERAIADDLATTVLEDQVDGLTTLASEHPELDLRRVGIMGWSFGGYLSALAVLRRPDVFHAAVAGAPVTDWTLYDTHYTERYLGDPKISPKYSAVSIVNDAPDLERPLMIIHGLSDDNVVAAHSLRLSGALLAAGRSHTLLPLSGVTHMTPQEEVAENLLLLQVDFLRRALAPPGGAGDR